MTGQTNRRVFVLGAGASKAVNSNSPLNDELLSRIIEHSGKSALSDFVFTFYHINPKDQQWKQQLPSIEDVLSQVDFALNEKRPLSHEYDLDFLESVRQEIIGGICHLLSDNRNHAHGMNKMYQFMSSLTPSDTLISLNYDLVVDKAVCQCKQSPQYVDYGVPIRYAIEPNGQRSEYPAELHLKVYKLHGSLNWLYCPRCQHIDVPMAPTGRVLDVTQYGGHNTIRCVHCTVPYETIMIAPTFFKSYNNGYVAQIWREAEEAFCKAGEIIFVGYSMPDADIVLRCMFKRAYYAGSTFGDHKHATIRVVDIESGSPDVKRRFENLFRTIDYDDSGFEKYIDRGCKTLKQAQETSCQPG
jgi:hypothetical protein